MIMIIVSVVVKEDPQQLCIILNNCCIDFIYMCPVSDM